MNPFFVYLIKSSLSLALFYIVFKLAVSRDKMHAVNRFVLLGILIGSAIIPFLNIQFFYEEIPIKQVEVFRDFVSAPVFSNEISPIETQPVHKTADFHINFYLIFYLAIIVALLIRLLISVFQVLNIIQQAEKRRLKKIILAVVKDFIQPFSFLNKIVISEKDYVENKDIVVTHEHAHIKQLHAVDLVVCEVFTVLHFFNPFIWLLRHDLKLIHEYQADQAVLNKGIDAKKYQLLVLQKSVGERRFAMANHFTQKPILKRIKMMQQKNRKQWAALKLILFLPLLVILLQAFARPELITNTEDFISVKYTENKTEQWLSRWTADNIGKGFYEPELNDINVPRKANNVLVILMNRNDDFLIEDQRKNKEEVKQIVKNYLLGSNPDRKNDPDYGEKEIPFIGRMKVSKGMIVYKHDLASSKEMIDYTLRNIGEACLEVRKEKAQILFAKDYFDLDEEKLKAVDQAVPVWFSYESPKSPTPNVWLPFEQKPSSPDPLKITFKSNGNVIVENHIFKTFEAFERNLKDWKKNLEDFNKDRRSKGFYRAHLFFEDYSQERVKEINYLMYKNNIHVGHISDIGTKRNLVSLENEKLDERLLASTDKNLALLENFQGESTSNLSFEEEKHLGKNEVKDFQNVKLSPADVPEIPSFLSIILEKSGDIIYNNSTFNYNDFEVFLKNNYRRFRKKSELSAEIKWDTAVGYQGIRKVAKLVERNGFKNIEYRPFNESGFLPPVKEQQKKKVVSVHLENEGFVIEIKNDGNYIDNKLFSLDEISKKAKAWQKTGREDILLVLDEQMPLGRIDEVRVALSNAKVYHVNQTTINSDEIIYPAGDVSKLANFTQGSWRQWWESQLKNYMKDIPAKLEYKILYSFIIDKNGKVSDGHVVKGCEYPDINEAYNKVLAQIPTWKPAIKGNEVVSVYYKIMDSRRNK